MTGPEKKIRLRALNKGQDLEPCLLQAEINVMLSTKTPTQELEIKEAKDD